MAQKKKVKKREPNKSEAKQSAVLQDPRVDALEKRIASLEKQVNQKMDQLAERNSALLRKVTEQMDQLAERNAAILRKLNAPAEKAKVADK